jgi:hypothetical protein
VAVDKIPQAQSGYMELAGARKDADCGKVEVKGGISMELGCCNYFEPENSSVSAFRCGNCEYHEQKKRNPFYGE